MTLKESKLASAAPVASESPAPLAAPKSAVKLRNIAILGTAPLSRPFAPAFGDEWEIWALGNPVGEKPTYDRFYEIHNPNTFASPEWAEYRKWLTTVECPVWAFHPIPGVKDVRMIPRQEIENEFGSWFQTSSVTWAVTHALLEHIGDPTGEKGQKIGRMGFWGVEMATNAEYAEQKPACMHWIWFAQRYLGIRITLPNVSELCLTGLPYPFNVESAAYNRVKQRWDLLERDIKNCENSLQSLREVLAKLTGAREEMRAQLRTLVTPV